MRRSRGCLRLGTIVLGLLCIAGCSGLRPPRITVTGASVSERSDEAVRIDVDVELVNPNVEPLELRQFTYTFSVDGRAVFSGRRSAEATLGPAGTRHVVLPAIVRFDQPGWDPVALPDAFAWRLRGELLYLDPGALAETLLDMSVREPRVTLSGSGDLALDGR